jgi:hypothetical protein
VGLGHLGEQLRLAARDELEVREAPPDLLEHPGEPGDVAAQAERLGQPRRRLGGARLQRVGDDGRLGVGEAGREDLVRDEQAEMQAPLGERGHEAGCLVGGHRLEGGHDHEGRPLVAQQRPDCPGAGDESFVHALEQKEELPHVLEELGPEDAVCHLVERPRGERHEARARRRHEPAQQPRGEELRHPPRRVEEVESLARGRRVDDDEVVLALGVDLVEPLHRDVLVPLGEAAADVLVDRVGEDPLCRRLVGRLPPHEGVPGLLGVEHRGEQRASGLDARRDERLSGHPSRGVADPSDAEGVGEAPSRVDGYDEDLRVGAHGGHDGEGGGGRRLADPSGPPGDDDLARGEQAVERRRGRAGAHAPSSSPRASATWRTARAPWERPKR